MVLRRGKIPTASQTSHACGWLSRGTSSLISSGKTDISQLYMEAEQQATEGILLFKPATLFN